MSRQLTYKGQAIPGIAYVAGSFYNLETRKIVKGHPRSGRKPLTLSPSGPFLYGTDEEIQRFRTENSFEPSSRPTEDHPPETRIFFYDPKDEYGEFSNFYPAPIEVDGVHYTNTEQYFQAQKFNIPGDARRLEYFHIIANADSPMKIKMLGSQDKRNRFSGSWLVNKQTDFRRVVDVIDEYQDVKMREDWEMAKDDVMRRALQAKFTQNPKLRDRLRSTGTAYLAENSLKDSYWGLGKDGNGKNMLGKLLMEVRSTL